MNSVFILQISFTTEDVQNPQKAELLGFPGEFTTSFAVCGVMLL